MPELLQQGKVFQLLSSYLPRQSSLVAFLALYWEEKLGNSMFTVSKTRTQAKLSLRNHLLSPGYDFLNIAAPSPEMEAQPMHQNIQCLTNYFLNKKYLFSISLCCSFL